MLRYCSTVFFLFLFINSYGQNAQKGGYIYGWSAYTSDETTGLGNRAVIWDSTDLVDVVHAPAIGVHPRVYFGPSEIPDIKYRMDSTISGQSVKATIHAYTTLLHLGSTYQQNQPYALDSDGNRHIDNSGAWNAEPFYTKLKNHDPTVWNGASVKNRHRTAAL